MELLEDDVEFTKSILNKISIGGKISNAAYGELYNRYQPIVYEIANRLLKNSEDAEDVTQQFFINILTKELSTEIESLKGYFVISIKNYCLNILKKGKDQVLGYINEIENYENKSAKEINLTTEIVLQDLDKLAPRTIQAITLKYIKGLEYTQVAEEMKISHWTVKKLVQRGIKRLRNKDFKEPKIKPIKKPKVIKPVKKQIEFNLNLFKGCSKKYNAEWTFRNKCIYILYKRNRLLTAQEVYRAICCLEKSENDDYIIKNVKCTLRKHAYQTKNKDNIKPFFLTRVKGRGIMYGLHLLKIKV